MSQTVVNYFFNVCHIDLPVAQKLAVVYDEYTKPHRGRMDEWWFKGFDKYRDDLDDWNWQGALR